MLTIAKLVIAGVLFAGGVSSISMENTGTVGDIGEKRCEYDSDCGNNHYRCCYEMCVLKGRGSCK